MYRHVLGILALFVATSLLAQVPSAVERELIELENDWGTAIQKKDTAFFQRLYADEYLSTDPDGATYTKAQSIAGISGGFELASFTLTDLKVRVYGDTAVVTAANTMKATFNGKDVSGTNRFTDVFVKRDGRWQAVATHFSRVAQK